MRSVGEIVAAGNAPRQSASIFREMVDAMPQTADFGAIETALPPDWSHPHVAQGRASLMRKWAGTDPEAALDRIMANTERIAPGAVESAMEAFVNLDAPAAIDWMQDISSGAYRDSALRAGFDVILLDYPVEARQLAELVGDQAMRDEMMRSLDTMGER